MVMIKREVVPRVILATDHEIMRGTASFGSGRTSSIEYCVIFDRNSAELCVGHRVLTGIGGRYVWTKKIHCGYHRVQQLLLLLQQKIVQRQFLGPCDDVSPRIRNLSRKGELFGFSLKVYKSKTVHLATLIVTLTDLAGHTHEVHFTNNLRKSLAHRMSKLTVSEIQHLLG